jgi:hypothetical protein
VDSDIRHTFRLNSRGYLRERVDNNNSTDDYASSSVRQSKIQYKRNRAESTTLSFNVRQATVSDLAGEKHDYEDTEPSPLELGKSVRMFPPTVTYRN